MSDKELRLISPIPPSVNHYMGYRGVRKGSGCIVMAYTTKEAKEFKRYFQKYAKEQVKLQEWDIAQTKDVHHYLDCVFYFDRTDKDEQNYMKVLCDTLNGIAYIDDKKILTRTHEIYYDGKNPRIEITIKPVEYRGIFPSEVHLVEFEEKCKECKRYRRNCSILRKAKEGRVQDEISDEFECVKFSGVNKEIKYK